MDVDIVKTSSDGSMDMISMMMQMEKFPDQFSEPFYPTTYQDIITNNNNTVPLFNLSSPQPLNNIDPNLHSNVNFQQHLNISPSHLQTNSSSFPYSNSLNSSDKKNSMAAMREMIFRIAVMQPIHIDPESIRPPKRRNVKISKDPQSVAARHRRERISERIRILQRLVPGGTKMDTASMLDEAIHYVKFLKKQVQTLEQVGANNNNRSSSSSQMSHIGGGVMNNFNVNYSGLMMKGCQPFQMVGSTSKQLLS
ncbi:hypothetical protein TSUD_191200 [Trifolium subterraneum]|uniref:BHLH domain-containing protein n=1 Tax=Trifolium subterraneum TaxID=3900 RepID=A0A2Z6PJ21_TRISU|nr:hypothetical protein TSUD_191200 [Trifolium subterraneum]